jgi:uncharacterized membrane protein
MDILKTYFLWFIVYSMIGWIYESIICSIGQQKLVNRGFLNGPYCPIYGFGAIIDIMILGKLENTVLIFFLGAILACSLEYFTSWAMEKLFHARWWDYSSRRFNFKGRICLLGAIVFGTLSAVLIKIIHPVVYSYTYRIQESTLNVLSLALFIIFLSDTVYTVAKLSKFEEKLKELSYHMNDLINGDHGYKKLILEKIKDIEIYEEVNSIIHNNILKKINFQEKRILKAFPKLRSLRYNAALQKVRELIEKAENSK